MKLERMKKMVNQKLLIGLGVMALGYVIYRIITAPQRQLGMELQKEITEVLTKDEFKVKGRYE